MPLCGGWVGVYDERSLWVRRWRGGDGGEGACDGFDVGRAIKMLVLVLVVRSGCMDDVRVGSSLE
jgi:hypothetical protein